MNRVPYLTMSAEVLIAGEHNLVKFQNVSSIEITENIREPGSTATVVLPRFYGNMENKSPLDFIKCGDRIVITFGYQETNTTQTIEFDGFISEIGSETPLELKCDQMYHLRQKNSKKSYKSVKLKEVLHFITQGTSIKTIQCPDVDLGRYELNNTSTYQELLNLKDRFGFFSRLSGSTLRVGFAYDWNTKETQNHIYKVQANVRSSDLTYKREENFNVRLRVKIRNGKDKDTFIEKGSKANDAKVHTLEYSAANKEAAEKILNSIQKQNLYDGYTGSITGFGFPITNAGDSLTIKDDKEPGREGTYLIQKVVKSYGSGGISRKNELAFRVIY